MAYCIDCGAVVEPTAFRCHVCGIRIPMISQVDVARRRPPDGWAYSWPAELLLVFVRGLIWLVVAYDLCRIVVLVPIIVFRIKAADPVHQILVWAIVELVFCLLLLIVLTRTSRQ